MQDFGISSADAQNKPSVSCISLNSMKPSDKYMRW